MTLKNTTKVQPEPWSEGSGSVRVRHIDVFGLVRVLLCFLHVSSSSVRFYTGWRGGLVVGRRTCDLRVAGSRPGRDAAAQQP